MPVYSGAVLSNSSNGRPIPVAAVASPGTNLHTAGSSGFDEVYLWASNVTTASATLTIEWGGTSNPGDRLVNEFTIPANSVPIPIALGQRVSGGVLIKAFSGTASAINITGYVNQVR